MKQFVVVILLLLGVKVAKAQCVDPNNISANSITETSASLSWTEQGAATSWEVEVVISGTVPTGVGVATNVIPFLASNLVSGGDYEFYVRSNCTTSGYSNWIGPVIFSTLPCDFSTIVAGETGGCLEYCFFPDGPQFGTYFDFNSGNLPVGWNSSPYTVGSACYTDMTDNTPYFWAGQIDTDGERKVTTNILDVSLGGIIQFYMRYGSDDPTNGCEDPDLTSEGVFLQYSIDGGGTWVTINNWVPLPNYTGPLYQWNQYTENIPPAAQTANTRFRWYQPDQTSTSHDNWGLDNVLVSANNTANFLWDFGDGTTSTEQAPCHTFATTGTYPVTLSVNSPNCFASTTSNLVVEDLILPTSICQNLTLTLDSTGNAVITPANIDNGSFDNCGIQGMLLSQTNFDCGDIGVNNVILTVTDVYGNVSNCTATVTISPTYEAPSSINVITLTETSVEISWTQVSNPTSWNIEIVPSGTTPTGVGITTTNNPYIASGLIENTQYDVYIQANDNLTCSEWAMITFDTPCSVFSVPYVEPVETQQLGSANTIDNCWSAQNTVFQWRVDSGGTPSVSTGPNAAANGSNYFYTEASSGSFGSVAELYSPFFDLTTSTNTFLHFNYHMYGSNMGSLHVDLFDGTNWVNDIRVLSGQNQTSHSQAWIQEFIDISMYETVSNFQVRFRGVRGSGFRGDMSIDDITIESILACDDPSNLILSNPTLTTIDFSWLENGTASTWEIEVLPTGDVPTGVGIVVNTNPYTVTGLTPNTTYDFYVQAICGPANESNWVGPVTMSTLCDDISFSSCPSSVTIQTISGQCYGVPNYILPTLVDNCDLANTTPLLVQGLAVDGHFPIGDTVVSYSGTNSVGTSVFCTFTVTVEDPFQGLLLEASSVIPSSQTLVLCNDDAVNLFVSGGSFDGSETYQWELDSMVLNGETNSGLSDITSSGVYTVTISLGTCNESFSVTIQKVLINSEISYPVVDCTFAMANIDGTLGGVFSFVSLPQDNATIDPVTGDINNGTFGETYLVNYTVVDGPCVSTSETNVTLWSLDDADFQVNAESVTCDNVEVVLLGVSGGMFSLSSPSSDNAVIDSVTGQITNASPDTTYTILYTTNDLCSNTYEVTVTTLKNCVIPSGISPNNDGINDSFEISWLRATNITIYNRHGVKVYGKENYRNEWSGFSDDNQELPVGTYYYSIETIDNTPILGWVYINR